MDDPGGLLPGHQSHEATLNFELAFVTNQSKKVVSNRKRTIFVRRCKSQAHVTVTEGPLAAVTEPGSMSPAGIIGRIHIGAHAADASSAQT